MTYVLIEDYTLEFTGGPMKPQGWAIHWWGDPAQNPTFNGILNVLITRSAQKSASVNFMAESGKVACLVDPFTVAWAQGDGGNGWGNNNLVSVECNPRCTAEDRETVAELIADQNIQNGIPIVLYPHKNFTSTACPGVWEQWIPWLTERANQIVAEKKNGVVPVTPVTETKEEDEKMLVITAGSDGKIWIGDGITRYHIPNPKILSDYKLLASWGVFKIYAGGEPQNVPPEVLGKEAGLAPSAVIELTDTDVDSIASKLKLALSEELASELAKRLAD